MMHALRKSRLAASLVLFWLMSFLGSAVASTMVDPGSLQVVCSAAGVVKLVDLGDEGEPEVAGGSHCPLCASAPPSPPRHDACFESYSPLTYTLRAVRTTHIPSITAPPLPSRGPPSFLR